LGEGQEPPPRSTTVIVDYDNESDLPDDSDAFT
jgi:hypothetical protein